MSTIPTDGNAQAPIQPEHVTILAGRPPQFTDEAALQLCVQDAGRAEMWLDQKQWTMYWREIDILYQAPRYIAGWENSTTTRSNVSRFTVAKHTNSLVPTMMSGIFYDDPCFILRPRPATKQSSARAWTELLSALLEEMEFRTESEGGIESQVLNGTGIWKYGCYTERKIEKKFVRKKSPIRVNLPFNEEAAIHTAESDEFEVEEVEVERWRPFFEYCPLGTVLVDPGWRHANKIHKAKFVIHRTYPTMRDLEKLRGQDGYDIPSTEVLKALFFPPSETPIPPGTVEQQQQANNQTVHHAAGRDERTTVDPTEQPLKMDERWDGSRVITVLQDKLIIRNEEHMMGCITFLSANWWNIQNAGYGLGIGRLVGSDQRVEQGSTNAALDILSLAVNQTYLRSRGANVPTQQIRQRLGGIIDVDGDIDKAFKVLDPPKVPGEVWGAIQNSKQSAESAAGADEAFTQGTLPARGGSSVGRSGTGAAGLIAANASRIQGPVGRFVDNVMVPLLQHLMEMVCERMPISQIRAILKDRVPDLNLDMDDFLNAKLTFEALAGAHLAAKKAMAQSLPYIIELFNNPHIVESLNSMGQTLDVKELLDMVWEISEWKNSRDVIRPMTKQELALFQQMNPGMAKMNMEVAKIQAKHQATSEEIDQKAEARTAEKLLTDANARAAAHEERQDLENRLEPMMESGKQTRQAFATQ